ncbi:11765_t:CDS:2 [Entrophospora sp. SA101]|nr:11765_t:CDS:2 [Entrophospora sp. SA101]
MAELQDVYISKDLSLKDSDFVCILLSVEDRLPYTKDSRGIYGENDFSIGKCDPDYELSYGFRAYIDGIYNMNRILFYHGIPITSPHGLYPIMKVLTPGSREMMSAPLSSSTTENLAHPISSGTSRIHQGDS